MFERRIRLDYYMCDTNRRLSPPMLFLLLNDILGYNVETYGAGADYHIKRQLAWVLVEYEIDIIRMPKMEETVRVGTLPYSFKRATGYRIYDVKSENGDVLIKGKGKFVLINLKNKTMVKPDQTLLDKFKDAHKTPISLDFTKIRPSRTNLIDCKTLEIPNAFTDEYGHMNNAYYIRIAYEYLPRDILDKASFSKIKVLFKKECFAGDKVNLKYYQEEAGIWIDVHADDHVAASVYFQIKTKR